VEKFLEQFTKFPWQQKVGALAALLIVICVADYFLIVAAQMEEMATLDQEEAPEGKKQQVKKKLLEKQQQASHLTEYKREVERLKQQVKEAQEQLPTLAEIPKLMRDVAYEGQQSGLVIRRFELTAEQAKGNFSAVPVRMQVEGSYHEVAVFLDRLSKMPRIVNVTNISLRTPHLVNKKIVLAGEYMATTFRFIEKKK
jgi:type IV pilus assembly protein PilO